jgi:HKD family nuclease
MSNFITNTDAKDLKKRLIDLIQKSDELKFLVGFFYFSGIRELYKGLKEKVDKWIVGFAEKRTVKTKKVIVRS